MLPNSQITAFSNSRTQKEYIDSVALEKGLTNVNVITGNVVDFEFEPSSFDRVVSIEAGCPYTKLTNARKADQSFPALRAYEELRAAHGESFSSVEAGR